MVIGSQTAILNKKENISLVANIAYIKEVYICITISYLLFCIHKFLLCSTSLYQKKKKELDLSCTADIYLSFSTVVKLFKFN